MKPAVTNRDKVIDFHDVEYASINHTKQNTTRSTTPTGMLLDVQYVGGAKNMGTSPSVIIQESPARPKISSSVIRIHPLYDQNYVISNALNSKVSVYT